MSRKDLKNIWLIILLFIVVLIVGLNSKFVFGNTINYFKELDVLSILKNNYLRTKKIVPVFVNDNGVLYSVYNYAKYGLFNPLVILSYFINFDLGEYYSVLSVISLGTSIILLYKFLFDNRYNRYSILITITLLIIGIDVYNIMFNSIIDILVFPFIIMAFMGAKKRLDSNKMILLSISILLISVTNYTYLLPVIISLLVYGIYNYYINNKVLLFKKFFWYIVNYVVPILIGLLISSFVLIPSVDKFDWNYIDSIVINYSINIIIILSIIYGIVINKRMRFLSVILLLSIVLFSKYYLSYVVLLSILVCNFIEGIVKNKIDYRVIIIGIVISLVYLVVNINNLITIIILLFSMCLYIDTKKKISLLLIVLFIFINTLYGLGKENFYNKDLIISNRDGINSYNTMYQMLVGNNIIDNDLIGYNKYRNDKEDIYYKNNDVLYKGFATNNVISYEDYGKLNGLAKQEVVLTNIVTDSHSKNEYVSYVKKMKLEKDSYYVRVKDNNKYIFELEKEYRNKIIYIEMDVISDNCDNGRIRINNVDKYISCQQKKYAYTISDNNLMEIVVSIDKGTYKISNIKAYYLDYGRIDNSKIELDEFVVKEDKNNIIGEINVSGDGYFVITIPYDKGYKIELDGIITKYEMVDNYYIGIPISKGKHIISINSDKRYRLMSGFFSYIGVVFMYLISYLERMRTFT